MPVPRRRFENGVEEMRRMKVSIKFALVWGAVTASSVTVSWAGVGDALRGTVLASPDLAAGIPVATRRPPAPPTSASDTAPSGRPTPARSSAKRPSQRARARKPPSPGMAPDALAGKRRTYNVRCGRVVLAVTPRSAELVSAAPDNGFQTKVWRQTTWIRVELTDGAHGSTVIASWNDHPTIVQVYEY
ncbi:hypothetical protein [Actinomadura violacea]|uniref:Secreted protein n=1 Tax=Actinomadura violacea TaxID=2819934 RepID=A0ABS3S7S9_9ACTN|nr:hypothetical protein [Actinomadura violacea]MBO2465064.1 hypothetical protein [Actinomadura violacea]